MKIKSIKKLNLILIIFLTGFIFFNFKNLPSEIPLFYSRPWGQDQLAPKSYIFLLPAISFLVFLLNSFLSKLIFKKNGDLLIKISIITSGMVSLLLSISVLKIIFLVI